MKTIVFRVDAGLHMGSGHVMRCLSLADTLHKQGAKCVFICRLFPGNLCDLIEQKGYQVYTLSQETLDFSYRPEQKILHEHWLGVNWQEDADQTINCLKQLPEKPDWLIIDHYSLNKQWATQLAPYTNKIMVIDDFTEKEYLCDIFLDQNWGRHQSDYDGLIPDNCMLLIGSKYILLRDEFKEYRVSSLERRQAQKELQQILVNLGGVDADNMTGRILNALKQCILPQQCKIVVVMGRHAPGIKEVQVIAQSLPYQTEVLVDTNRMAQIMAESDVAIGAAGGTSWERFCLGLPSILTVITEHQLAATQYFEKKHLALILKLDTEDEQISYQLAAHLSLLQNSEARLKLTENMKNLVDGDGCQRVASLLMAS